MAVTIVSFRWLEILEKEFDKNFVDLDLLIGELDGEEPDFVYSARQKLAGLSSCFAQLTHKAQTVFQNSAKIEAELIDVRAELVNCKARQEVLEDETRNLVLQLHSLQLDQLPATRNTEQYKEKIETALKHSPTKSAYSEEVTLRNKSEVKRLRNEVVQYQKENVALRNSILALHSEVYGARLAAKYLDKELAGRIQQLQLLGKEMRTEMRDKLWRQLESEILLHRHKTVIRACRNRTNHEFMQAGQKLLDFSQSEKRFISVHKPQALISADVINMNQSGDGIFFNKSEPSYNNQSNAMLFHSQSDMALNDQSEHKTRGEFSSVEELSFDNINNNSKEDLDAEGKEGKTERDLEERKVEAEEEYSCMIGEKRTVVVKRQRGQGLGISITGGREHGVPILISELEVGGPAHECRNLFVGDAIIKVNNISLENASHFDAVKVLTNLDADDVRLLVQFIAVETDDENSLSEDLYGYRYRFFDAEVMDSCDALGLHPLHANAAHGSHTPTAPRTPDCVRDDVTPYSNLTSPKESFSLYYSSPTHSDDVFPQPDLKHESSDAEHSNSKLIDIDSDSKPDTESIKIDLFGFRFQTEISDSNIENGDLLDDFLIKNTNNSPGGADLIQMDGADLKCERPEAKFEYVDENIFSGLDDHSLLDNIVKSFSEDDFSYLDNEKDEKDKNVTSDSGLEIYLSGSDIDLDKHYLDKKYRNTSYLNDSIDNSPEKIELKTLQQIFDRSFSSNLSSPRGSTSFDEDIFSTEHSDEKNGNSGSDLRNRMNDMKNTYNHKKIQKFYPRNMESSDEMFKSVVLKSEAGYLKKKRNSKCSRKMKDVSKRDVKIEKRKNSKEFCESDVVKVADNFAKKAGYKVTERFEENLIEYNVKDYDIESPDIVPSERMFLSDPTLDNVHSDEIEETRKLSQKYGLKIPGKMVKASESSNIHVAEDERSPDRSIKVIEGHFKHFKPALEAGLKFDKEVKPKAFRMNRYDSFGDPDFGTPV